MTATIRTHVLLIHQQALTRAALRSLVETWPEIEHVSEVVNISDALVTIARKPPDLILLDADSYADLGVAAISALQSVAQRVRVLLLCSEQNLLVQRQAIHMGAMGVVPKEKPPEVLHKAMQRVMAGEVWLERAAVAHVLTDLAIGADKRYSNDASRIEMLTKRERQVVMLIGEGLKNKQIAIRLAISEPTVRHHLTSIFEKLGVKNRLELVIFAHRHDLSVVDREARSAG